MPYRVPEVWLFRNQQLLIYQFQGEEYRVRSHSQYFPDVDLSKVIAQCLEIAYQRNTSAAIRYLKSQS